MQTCRHTNIATYRHADSQTYWYMIYAVEQVDGPEVKVPLGGTAPR